MAISHGVTTRNAFADQVTTDIDKGSGAGKLQLLDTGDTVLCELTLNKPSFGAASNGIITLITAPAVTGTTVTAGTVTKFRMVDDLDAIIYQGTVTGVSGGGDLEIENDVLGIGDIVTFSSHSYTASP